MILCWTPSGYFLIVFTVETNIRVLVKFLGSPSFPRQCFCVTVSILKGDACFSERKAFSPLKAPAKTDLISYSQLWLSLSCRGLPLSRDISLELIMHVNRRTWGQLADWWGPFFKLPFSHRRRPVCFISAALSLLCAGDLRGLVPYYWFLMSKQDPLDRHEMGF